MTPYPSTASLLAKCQSYSRAQTLGQRLAPLSLAFCLCNTRADTILRLTKKDPKKNPERKNRSRERVEEKCEAQIMRERNRHRDMLNYGACPSQAWRAVFRGAECSVALTRGEGKVAEIDDSLWAVHTLRADANTALP